VNSHRILFLPALEQVVKPLRTTTLITYEHVRARFNTIRRRAASRKKAEKAPDGHLGRRVGAAAVALERWTVQ
jgi:hypothetical protein